MKTFWNLLGALFVILMNAIYFYNPEWLEAGKLTTLLFEWFIACIDVMAFANLLSYRPRLYFKIFPNESGQNWGYAFPCAWIYHNVYRKGICFFMFNKCLSIYWDVRIKKCNSKPKCRLPIEGKVYE